MRKPPGEGAPFQVFTLIPHSPQTYPLSHIPVHDPPTSLSPETAFSLVPTQDCSTSILFPVLSSVPRDPDPHPIPDPRDFLPSCQSLAPDPGPPTPPPRRNQNYLDILRLLSLGDRQLSAFDISLRFTHLFWFGDLNYRLDMDIQVRTGPLGGCEGSWAGGQLGSHLWLWLKRE